MVSITVSVPEKTKKLMKEFEEMNWSGFVKKSIETKALQLQKIKALKKQLADEEHITNWSVNVQKVSRSGRIAALKKQGLL